MKTAYDISRDCQTELLQNTCQIDAMVSKMHEVANEKKT